MKILLLAPHPFYQERGTPMAVDLVLRVLSARGDTVDVLTYHEGQPMSYPGVRLHRIGAVRWVRNVRPGPSLKKLICDAALLGSALRMAQRGGYDVVHAVEESAFIALLIKRFFGVPYLYDMDSSLVEQIVDKYAWSRPLRPWLRWCERLMVRHAEVVLPVCDALGAIARSHGARRVTILRDICLAAPLRADGRGVEAELQQRLGVAGPIVMYVGNLERYQGIDLLLESFALAHRRRPDARLVVIGGAAASVHTYQAQARRLQLDSAALFLGPRPVGQLGDYLAAADLVVSPRVLGRNTPMKIYSYLGAGKAILATDLPTHTQVLDAGIAMLAAPSPVPFAEAMLRLLEDASLRQRLGHAAQHAATARHSYDVFVRTLSEGYDALSRKDDR